MEFAFSSLWLNVVILFLAQTSVKTTPLCPDKCHCTGGAPYTSLNVDCLGHTDIDHQQLSDQLDLLLSSNLTYGRLTSLCIINSPLMHVPRSICRLSTLTHLYLYSNRLTRLPDNCLCNLTTLTVFIAYINNIMELQNGLFDGLRKLAQLDLSHNRISSIGLRVFNSSAMLTSLTKVDLADNRIAALEPWPFIVGLNGRWGFQTPISLAGNKISAFTNRMGWKSSCDVTVHFDLQLRHNPIKHISDVFDGWNLSLNKWLYMNKHYGKAASHVSFTRNHLVCDCIDFDLYKIILFGFYHSDFADDVYCASSPSMAQKLLTAVSLDQFVCELTESCPAGCRCVHRPANATLHVYCSNTNLTVLPLELPELPKSYTKYKLDFSNNRFLRRLEYRDYFASTSILDVSNCNLDSIDFVMWNKLANITQVFLAGNRLQSLPTSVASVSMETAHIGLSRNPWKCSCDASWMSGWLKSVNRSLFTPDGIVCSSPQRLKDRKILDISDVEFCVDPTSEAVKRALTISITTIAGTVVVLLSVGVIVYRLRIKVYSRWKFHPFDRDECVGEDMLFDVFLSFSSHQSNLPHAITIREQLEQRGYLVCYPQRDFVAGEGISENVYAAVVRSKRTVCLLTAQFLQRLVSRLITCEYSSN